MTSAHDGGQTTNPAGDSTDRQVVTGHGNLVISVSRETASCASCGDDFDVTTRSSLVCPDCDGWDG